MASHRSFEDGRGMERPALDVDGRQSTGREDGCKLCDGVFKGLVSDVTAPLAFGKLPPQILQRVVVELATTELHRRGLVATQLFGVLARRVARPLLFICRCCR